MTRSVFSPTPGSSRKRPEAAIARNSSSDSPRIASAAFRNAITRNRGSRVRSRMYPIRSSAATG